jgi:hypothetical protein
MKSMMFSDFIFVFWVDVCGPHDMMNSMMFLNFIFISLVPVCEQSRERATCI